MVFGGTQQPPSVLCLICRPRCLEPDHYCRTAVVRSLGLSATAGGPHRLGIVDWRDSSNAGAVAADVANVGQASPVLARAQTELSMVFKNLLPVIASRGVVQLSGYIDNLLASLLPSGAVAALNYAQILYLLPISLFGMSVAAAELPAMSQATGLSLTEGAAASAEILRRRLDAGLRQISFLVIPSAAAFLFIGDRIVAVLFQSGVFHHRDVIYVWSILAGSAVGMLAATMGRLYNSTYYALSDTRTPLRFAMIRVGLTLILGYLAAIVLPPDLGLARRWGVVGLSGSAGIAAWVEFSLLRRTLNRRLGPTGVGRR